MTIMSMVQRVRWRQYAAAGLCALVTLLFMSSAWAQAEPIPPLTDWVTDTTATFTTQQKQALSTQLQSLEEEKGSQIFVLIVPTTGEDTIESYARRAYDAWQVGRESVDDGILLVVAKADRRLRIEVGYGLEGAVTDLQSGRIIREQITPGFVKTIMLEAYRRASTP
ncbi:TPM domain-containing protein [Paenalcaligenes niemegkensis]|uniref:TPM domain-containing protein n=1 Tax=Paenalcaligenes niemegkensis TaxID=2895469 RepID=UPI001EE9141D|nr:TPM domain-containing protein [Paenalcaligenes niemegkensis]MCQ9618033.1 TPM domain-containing protein [Paenalcaligenes niemegkensis]